MRAARSPLLLLLPLLAAACRDVPDPFTGVERPPLSGDTVHLTYFLGEDRAPAWRGGDTLYYATGGYDPFPASQGALAAVPRDGGPARLLLPELQQAAVFLTTPALSPSGDRVAFVALDPLFTPTCTGVSAFNLRNGRPVVISQLFRPPLMSARLTVRAVSGAGAPGDDPRVLMDFASVQIAPFEVIPGVEPGLTRYLIHEYPFQKDYAAGGAIPFRPSWSPDGRRLAFSDGLRLNLWTPGQAAVPLPGSERAVSAAWSPAGDRIAAARAVVPDSTVTDIAFTEAGAQTCAERRISYNVTSTRLVLLRPEGGAATDLGEGEEPAWSPDGTAIYVRRASSNQIWRVPVAGGAASPVPGTTGGHDPAVSPDGQWLAFARQLSPSNHDLWLVRLSH